MLIALRNIAFRFSNIKVPIVDVKPFLTDGPSSKADCKVVTEALHKYGCLVIKDPRVDQKENSDFLDLMEKYFSKRGASFYQGNPIKQVYPQYDFQVGATPEFTQICKDHKELLDSYTGQNKAATPSPPTFDAKWRYFWNITTGENVKSQYPNPQPEDFPQFTNTMDKWGRHMINGCYTVAQMAAVGMGLERETFSKMLDGGEHKLAPTGSDLGKFGPGTIFAGHHYDFNFLTIHGKSRYPGLFAWLRTGEKFTVQVPEGHLLLQAGKQFEWMTGGYINCGFHEVIYTDKVEEGKNQAVKEGRIPWRISSTLFSHLNLKHTMKPIGQFATPESMKNYPQISVLEHTRQELEAINLKGN